MTKRGGSLRAELRELHKHVVAIDNATGAAVRDIVKRLDALEDDVLVRVAIDGDLGVAETVADEAAQ